MPMIINISYHQRQNCHDITEILLKVALSTINPTPQRQVADMLLPGIVHFISGVTHMENDLLFCSKLMFTNGKIVVCKFYII